MIKRTIIFLILSISLFHSTFLYAEFRISIDRTFVDFGYMELGEFKEIKEKGEYHNEVTFKSDNGNIYYVKVYLLKPFRSGIYEISPDNLKWKIVEIINGTGYAKNRNQFNNFTTSPDTIYISSPDDAQGKEVKLKLGYGLKIPREQMAGSYECIIRFTLTETL